MIEALCCARRLIKSLGYFQTTKPKFNKGWLGASKLTSCINDIIGIPYPCTIKSFNLGDVSSNLEAQVMSYVKIGQNEEVMIYVNASNNHCWQRFFICKELIHVVASNAENATLGYSRINEVIERIQAENLFASGIDKAYDIELDAEFGAIELLLPKELVEAEDKRANGYLNYTDADIDRIAETYKVPKLVIKARLTNLKFRQAFEDCYKQYKFVNAEFSML